MFRKNRPWTPDDDKQLRTLLESGTSKTLVAAKLKRTVSAIEARVSVIKIPLREIKLQSKSKRK
jgi:hypothetical protein